MDPAAIKEDYEVENFLVIEGSYSDGENSLDYTIYIRPWGTVWDEVEDKNLPESYKDWYLPLIEAGKDMPDTIGN